MSHAKELNIAQALTVCAELTGTQFSDAACSVMLDDLMVYPEDKILSALNRCRRELTGRLTLAAILERIDTGLPSADEAFGMLVEGWKNDALTVVVPEIALQAAGNGAYELFANNDKTGARMAFRDAYQRAAADLLDRGGKVVWSVSKGSDRSHQVSAVMEAVRLGRLTRSVASKYLPTEAAEERILLDEGRVLSLEEKQRGQQHTTMLFDFLAGKIGAANEDMPALPTR